MLECHCRRPRPANHLETSARPSLPIRKVMRFARPTIKAAVVLDLAQVFVQQTRMRDTSAPFAARADTMHPLLVPIRVTRNPAAKGKAKVVVEVD